MMTREEEALMRRLEQATAAELDDAAPLDFEAAELRKTWLAFGGLLNVAEKCASTSRTLARPPFVVPRRSGLESWPLWLAATGVAAAVVAIVGVWWIGGPNHIVVRSFTPRESPAAVVQPSKSEVPSDDPVAPAADTRELAWDDEWDSSMMQAERVLAQFTPLRADREATWRDLRGRVDALAREIELEHM